jgi:hypothetical protein
MEVRQAPAVAFDPRSEKFVVDVLRFDRAQSQPLDRRLGQNAPDEAGEREGGARV